MTIEPDCDERLEKLRMLKEKLGAQEKELEKLLARLEGTEARRAAVIKDLGGTLNASPCVGEPPQEMSKLMIAINNLPDVKSIVE